MDRENVIKGLEEAEIILKQAVDRGGEMAVMGAFKCFNNVSNALALLKEDCHNCKLECLLQKYDELKEKYDALLKEQEAKTGYWIDSAGNDKCSICGEEYSDLYPDYGNTHFCPNCGAKMESR